MRRDEALRILAEQKGQLERFRVRSLSVFGSVARNEATAGSDVDILVEFDRPVGLLHFVRLRRVLEEALGRKVDLVTPGALKERMKDRILAEAVRAA